MRIDAYQIFASGCSESRLLEVLEANIHQVILLDFSISTSVLPLRTSLMQPTQDSYINKLIGFDITFDDSTTKDARKFLTANTYYQKLVSA